MSAPPPSDSDARNLAGDADSDGATASEVECAEIWGLIRAFLSGELSSAESRRMRVHLDKCGECRDEYRGAVMTAASIGHSHRTDREERELAKRRTSFRSLARDVQAGGRRSRKNWRLILYPVMAILVLSQISRIGRGGHEALRVEVLAGELSVGRDLLSPESGQRYLEAGERCMLDEGGLARVVTDEFQVELSGKTGLLIVGRLPLRLRHEWGQVSARGEGSIVTRLGVVDVLGGRAELSLGSDGLLLECVDEHVFFVNADGSQELAPGEQLRVVE